MENYTHPRKLVRAENLLAAFVRAGYAVEWGMMSKIAQDFKVSPQAVDRWLKNEYESQPSLDKLIKIAEKAGMSLDELIMGDANNQTRYKNVPILKPEEVIEFCTNESKQSSPENRTIPLIGRASRPFAIKNPDESMSFVTGKSYPQGAMLVFDAKPSKIKHDDLVLALCYDFVEEQIPSKSKNSNKRKSKEEKTRENSEMQTLEALNPSLNLISTQAENQGLSPNAPQNPVELSENPSENPSETQARPEAETESREETPTMQKVEIISFRRYYHRFQQESLLALNPTFPSINTDFQIIAKFLYAVLT